jgi:membrane associated rhomboid family serine protease
MIWGILPLQRGVSWEGHLFGFLGGVLAARILSVRRR